MILAVNHGRGSEGRISGDYQRFSFPHLRRLAIERLMRTCNEVLTEREAVTHVRLQRTLMATEVLQSFRLWHIICSRNWLHGAMGN